MSSPKNRSDRATNGRAVRRDGPAPLHGGPGASGKEAGAPVAHCIDQLGAVAPELLSERADVHLDQIRIRALEPQCNERSCALEKTRPGSRAKAAKQLEFSGSQQHLLAGPLHRLRRLIDDEIPDLEDRGVSSAQPPQDDPDSGWECYSWTRGIIGGWRAGKSGRHHPFTCPRFAVPTNDSMPSPFSSLDRGSARMSPR